MNCPKCASEKLRAIASIHTDDKNDEFCKGLLCGSGLCFLCNQCSMISGKTKTAILWVCENCGRKFKH